MRNKKFNNNDLIDLLIKKASGFYYSEEQYEYEKTQKRNSFNEKLTDFENNSVIYDRVNTQLNIFDDTIKSANGMEQNKDKIAENLTLVKKKVTTHYVSPDMLAIKILLEIYGKKVSDDNVENMSNQELIELKNKLIGELINDDNIHQ